MRLFLSLPIPVRLSQRLAELQSNLESVDWSLNLIPQENFHLTLHFLGETPQNLLQDLHHELSAAAHKLRPFDLACGGLGAFPSFEDPRVLWIGVNDRQGNLKALFEATRRVLNSYRLFKLREDFQAHISLARVSELRKSWDPQRLTALATQWDHVDVLPVEEFNLMQSDSGPGGPHYKIIESFHLAS